MNTQVELIACSTCGGARRDERGLSEGERLLEQLRTVQAERATLSGEPQIELSSVQCLWACKRSCAVHLRSPGRVGYVLAELDGSVETARGLLDYASLYGQSSDGGVPFKQWPQAVRGHFVCRLPVSTPPSAAAETPFGDDSTASEE
ncbi:MAG: hypothetical protein JWN48_3568 [Myxococcaceae bacterium]|nr:hypothetical protein [Myxococcaceae bacterium]